MALEKKGDRAGALQEYRAAYELNPQALPIGGLTSACRSRANSRSEPSPFQFGPLVWMAGDCEPRLLFEKGLYQQASVTLNTAPSELAIYPGECFTTANFLEGGSRGVRGFVSGISATRQAESFARSLDVLHLLIWDRCWFFVGRAGHDRKSRNPQTKGPPEVPALPCNLALALAAQG